MNVGVILSGPIQFILNQAARLLEAKAKFSAFAAASALRARQSIITMSQQSRRLFGKNRSQQLPSSEQDHTLQGTPLWSSSLIVQEVGTSSSAGVESTGNPEAHLQGPTYVASEQMDVVEKPAVQPHDQFSSCDEQPSLKQGIRAQLPMELAGEEVMFVATEFV